MCATYCLRVYACDRNLRREILGYLRTVCERWVPVLYLRIDSELHHNNVNHNNTLTSIIQSYWKISAASTYLYNNTIAQYILGERLLSSYGHSVPPNLLFSSQLFHLRTTTNQPRINEYNLGLISRLINTPQTTQTLWHEFESFTRARAQHGTRS